MLKNPYPKPRPGQTNHLVQARISFEDYLYLKQKFPMVVGLIDKTLSTLIHSLITHFRNLEKQNGQPFDAAFEPCHPTLIIYESLLQRCSFGDQAGQAGSRDVERGTGGVRQGDEFDASVSPDTQGRTDHGKETKKGKGGQRNRRSDGAAGTVKRIAD